MNKGIWEIVRENTGSASVTIPLFSLVLSGAFFFGFFSIVGFSNIGTIGVSDFSKAALSWSPTALILVFSFLTPLLSPIGKRLQELRDLQRSLEDGATPLDEIREKLLKIADDDSRSFFKIEEIDYRVSLLLCFIFNVTALYLLLNANPPLDGVYAAALIGFDLFSIIYYAHINERRDIIRYAIPSAIVLFLASGALFSGRETARNLIVPKSTSTYTISIKGKELSFDSYFRFDYSLYAYSKEHGLYIYDAGDVDFLHIASICADSFWTCRRKRTLNP